MSACQKAYEHLLSNPSTHFPISLRPTVNPEPKGTPKQRKRQYPSGDGPMAVDRIIQPRISDFSSVNEPFHPPAAAPPAAGPGEPPKKKRGRPSKAEYEIRMAEYAARGEPLPPPRKPKTPKRSTERHAPTATMFTPTPGGTGEGGSLMTPTAVDAGSVAGTHPAARPPPRPDTADPGTRNLALEATALAAEQTRPASGPTTEPAADSKAGVQTDHLEGAPELGPHEALMAQMQEHAASVEHQTADRDTPGRGPPAQEQRTWQAYQPPTST